MNKSLELWVQSGRDYDDDDDDCSDDNNNIDGRHHSLTPPLYLPPHHSVFISEHPSASRIHQTILSVARFLFDFARKSTSTPDFLRLG